jgi:hypothetical protein
MSRIDPGLIFIGALIVVVGIVWASTLWTADPSGLFLTGLWR